LVVTADDATVKGAKRAPRVAVELIALAAIVSAGVWLRLAGLSTRGLWRDDAWVALSSRVPIGTALRMGATAPGFTMIERAWIQLDPGSSWWAQQLPFALGVLGIVAMFLLARYLGLPAWLSLATAAFVALSPVTIAYSTHTKQYSTDVVAACALLGLGESARRRPGRRQLWTLAAASCVGFVISASVVVVVVGAWAMLVLTSYRNRDDRRRVVMVAAITGALCVSAGVLLYAHLSSALHLFWSQQHRFLGPSPIDTLLPRIVTITSTAIFKTPAGTEVSTAVGWVLVVVALAGLTAGSKVWSSGLAVGAAAAAAALGLIPWGTGRTDMVLYPALALLVAFGVERGVRSCARRIPAVPFEPIVASLLGVTLVLGVLRADVTHATSYPAVDARLLMKELAQHEQAGDLVFVNSTTRYPWVLQSPSRPRLAFGSGWGAGYTVISTRPDEFIAPSYAWETDYHPYRWARRATAASRLWFVGGGFPPSPHDLEYGAVLAAGWRPHEVLRATGCIAVLMTRS
jgi:hypothetical protein